MVLVLGTVVGDCTQNGAGILQSELAVDSTLTESARATNVTVFKLAPDALQVPVGTGSVPAISCVDRYGLKFSQSFEHWPFSWRRRWQGRYARCRRNLYQRAASKNQGEAARARGANESRLRQ